jgi:hypothetical protein
MLQSAGPVNTYESLLALPRVSSVSCSIRQNLPHDLTHVNLPCIHTRKQAGEG